MAEASGPHWDHLPSSLLSFIAELIGGKGGACRIKTVLRLVCSGWSVSLPLSKRVGGAEQEFRMFLGRQETVESPASSATGPVPLRPPAPALDFPAHLR